MKPPLWSPLVTGSRAVEFRQIVDEVVEEASKVALEPRDWGSALLYAYRYLAFRDAADRERAYERLDAALAALASGQLSPALYYGIAGTGWLCAHVDRCFDVRDDVAYEDVDDALLAVLRAGSLRECDLISGCVGVGVYFLERLPHAKAIHGLGLIVDLLAARATRDHDGVTWKTPARDLPGWQAALTPSGHYNLGVAHGVPGIIGFLAEVRRSGLLSDEGKELLRAATRWVLDQRVNGGLPHWIAEGERADQGRVAWCYGPLGAAIPLLLGADTETSRAEAQQLASHAARRRADAGVQDAGLCHGAAGNAHLLNRLYHATGSSAFRVSALYWLQRTAEMRCSGEGIAGFRTWWPVREGRAVVDPWALDASFLTGALGTALALLAAISSVEPAWDRVLLCRLGIGAGRSQEIISTHSDGLP